MYIYSYEISTSLYTGCSGNYVYTYFNLMISLLPWYIYSRRIVYTCFNLMISLLPWYVYSGYEFIYKVYWKFYANHDISLLFVRIHFVFFRIAYPYFLDFLDIRVGTSLYTRCTGNYARILYICFNYNCISIFSWYTCRYEFIYRVYWKLYADHDLSFICTLCFNFIIKFKREIPILKYCFLKKKNLIF